MTCRPLDPTGDLCPDDYYSLLAESIHDETIERLYPSTAPTDAEHHDAIIADTYPSRTEALAEGLGRLLDAWPE